MYEAKLQELDERIVQLLVERLEVGGPEAEVPDEELLKTWCETYEVELYYLQHVFRAFANQAHMRRRMMEPENLRTVIPMLRKVVQDGVVYELTHMMQYENCSVVFTDIRIEDPKSAHYLSHTHFQLQISEGSYHTRQSRGGGGGHHYESSFVVTPALPDETASLHFELLPREGFPHDREIYTKKLDQKVVFQP